MNTLFNDVTIVVPTLNEVDNVVTLTKRIDHTMRSAAMPYHVLFIDDHSTDGTAHEIEQLAKSYPVSLQLKDGERGKAQSVIQGFDAADSPFVAMIDADLQYPPEAIPRMIKKLVDNNADVALSKRSKSDAGVLRNFMSTIFNFVFVQSLFGIRYDTQSGLKVFRLSTYDGMKLTPSQWSFDLEFIVAALEKQSSILTHDIKFGKRLGGEAKIDIVKSSIELAKSSIQLRRRTPRKIIRAAYNLNVARFRVASAAI